jgi:antitoxin component YwqK of YwqJK toxin-antitoxin module
MSYNSSQYWVNQNGENVGPYSLDEIRLLEKSGDLDMENPACLVGEEEWLSVAELLGIGSPADPEVGTNGGRKIIMAKKTGMSLNVILTVILFLLLFICGGLFAFLKFNNSSKTPTTKVVKEQPGEVINIKDLASRAILLDTLQLSQGVMESQGENLPYSGWAKKNFPNGDKLSSLLKLEAGKYVLGFSWKPNGEKCKETSLNDGKGILVEYFQSGGAKKETSFRAGLINGLVTSWHENEQKSAEDFYVDGKLHGQSVSWHDNGQKIKQVFYMKGLKSGPYSYWTKDGQKFDEGTYKNGKLDGRRILWSEDGLDRTEEFYEDGELIPQVPPLDPAMDEELEDVPEGDSVLVNLLKLADNEEIWNSRAGTTSEVVKFIQERFEKSKIEGHEVFAELGLTLFRHARGDPSALADVMVLLESINNKWGISIHFKDGVFALSGLPESVSFGPITLSKKEFAHEFLGSLQGESRDLVVEDLKSLFSAVGLQFMMETDSVQGLVERKIWDKLSDKAEDAKSANLQFINGELSFKEIIEKKVKKINPQGQSIFETMDEEVSYTFSQQKARDRKIGPFFQVLADARAGFEEAKNGTLMIRTYSDLVIFSDKVSPNGASFLYPSVSIKFAGVAPLSEKTLIRFLQVETGELLEEPSVGRSTEKEFPF